MEPQKLSPNKIMKIIPMAITAAMLFNPAFAEEEKKKRPLRPNYQPSPELLKEFDKNGDAKLSEAEAAEMQKVMRERRQARYQELLKRFDQDGDGKLSDEERKFAHDTLLREMLVKYDANGDGKLDDAERAAMRKGEGYDPLMRLERPQRPRPAGLRGERKGAADGGPRPERRQRRGVPE